ncbi:MAG: hypothetical protein ABJN96_02405 [Marinomonas sp.]
MLTFKLIFSIAAIVVTFVTFIPYIRSIWLGKTKPHVFSWVVWGTTTLIVFFAQLEAKGGIGAWPIGVSGILTIGVAYLAFLKSADALITRSDWLFFCSALASLPFWYFTSDPMWAVILLTFIDLLGFGPTIRKAYHFPYEENLTFFMLFAMRNICALLALETYSLATVLFPLSVGSACLCLLIMVYFRRRNT